MNIYKVQNGRAIKLADQTRPLFQNTYSEFGTGSGKCVIAAASTETEALALADKFDRGEIQETEIPWAPMGTIRVLS